MASSVRHCRANPLFGGSLDRREKGSGFGGPIALVESRLRLVKLPAGRTRWLSKDSRDLTTGEIDREVVEYKRKRNETSTRENISNDVGLHLALTWVEVASGAAVNWRTSLPLKLGVKIFVVSSLTAKRVSCIGPGRSLLLLHNRRIRPKNHALRLADLLLGTSQFGELVARSQDSRFELGLCPFLRNQQLVDSGITSRQVDAIGTGPCG